MEYKYLLVDMARKIHGSLGWVNVLLVFRGVMNYIFDIDHTMIDDMVLLSDFITEQFELHLICVNDILNQIMFKNIGSG